MSSGTLTAIVLILQNYSIPTKNYNCFEEIKLMTKMAKADEDMVLLAINYLYKLIVSQHYQLHWSPVLIYSTCLWLALETDTNYQIDIQGWHERTLLPIRDIKEMELIIRGSLGHQLMVTTTEFNEFKSEFLKKIG